MVEMGPWWGRGGTGDGVVVGMGLAVETGLGGDGVMLKVGSFRGWGRGGEGVGGDKVVVVLGWCWA